jgi:hypothetical protein
MIACIARASHTPAALPLTPSPLPRELRRERERLEVAQGREEGDETDMWPPHIGMGLDPFGLF